MSATRGAFSSKLGFIMAAAGSAVGLGNIWGFPTQTASNGGAAFVLVYLILAFCLAFPAFMAELVIGRYGQSDSISALQKVAKNKVQKKLAFVVGILGISCAGLVLSFYSIVAGWMISHTIQPLSLPLGQTEFASWLVDFSFSRNLIFTAIFMFLTIYIVAKGVEHGIEKWSKKLMPILLFLLISLTLYVLTQDGAQQGVIAYLQPDFSRVLNPQLMLSALGQAFFSLSLGCTVMIIYGSYIPKQANIVKLGVQVTLIDVGIAFLAGLLIIPAMYVAQAKGVEIFNSAGQLLSEDTLVFTVLPSLFSNMGSIGVAVALVFFLLMTIAAVTSSISMLEGPVSYAVERHHIKRGKAAIIIGSLIFLFSVLIMCNFSTLFGLVITIATKYGQPIGAMFACIFVGWLWQRHSLLEEIKHGHKHVEHTLFWRIWPFYIKFICPVAIAVLFYHSLS